MTTKQTVRRGLRLGVRIGLALTALWGTLTCVAAAAFLGTGKRDAALDVFLRGTAATAGTMAVCTLLGAATGAALARAPEWLASRALLRGLLAGAVASTVFLAEALVIGAATYAAIAPVLGALLCTPVIGLVAAVHSGDVLGRTHYHPWLWGKEKAA
ncbi:hypothetical protein SRB5_46420 [Streptomyces sp. RB5]|uniref:Uncharacterized protein n=1 Tax=Streptomyces smaragdinus TaxID=2585196 RepID=A0A7K0CLW6_9ACTN|nr:hypothetical protein [Streptomyces smaragdinus]MQY14475.1 hypothetical protein [Streptomyces smaragdinus]